MTLGGKRKCLFPSRSAQNSFKYLGEGVKKKSMSKVSLDG